MPNARYAEFLLRHATTPNRASAIAGDLLEQYPHKPLRFAVAVASVMLALQWKQLLGFVAALFFFLPYAFPLGLHFLLDLPRTTGLHQIGVFYNVSRLLLVGMMLLAVSAFAFTKASTRRVATVSLMLAVTSFSAASYAFLHKTSEPSPQIATLVVALILIAIPASRRASLFSLATATAIYFTPILIRELAWTLFSPRNKPILTVFGVGVFAWIMAVTMGNLTLNALQRRFAPTPPPVIN